MDAAVNQVLLGVVSNGLFALLSGSGHELVERETVLVAVEESLQSLVEVPAIDEAIGGERLRAFLQSAEASAVLRQVFAAETLGKKAALLTSKEAFAQLYAARMAAQVDRRVPDRLFDVLVNAASAALAAALGNGTLEAHDALESLRHNVIADSLTGIERLLELIAGDEPGPSQRDIDDFAEAYREQIVERMGSITPPSFDAVRLVPIDELYVSPTLLVERDLSNELAISLSLSGLIQRLHRSVVLGSPGGGKSTLVRKLCHDIAFGRLEGELILNGTVPVLVTLREYGSVKLSRAVSIRDFIEERAHADFQLDVPTGAMEYLLRAGRVLMIFDGLDELLDTSYRGQITADIESFATLYPLTPILVTSRVVGYPEAPLDPRRFQTTRLGAFASKQVAEYATKWFGAFPSEVSNAPDVEVSEFLADSEEVDDLRSNPLMLALMCNLYRGAGYIPRNRPEVYEKCAVMLFERWDRGRRIQVQLDFERHLRPALQYLAHWIYSRPNLQSGAPERALVQQASSFLSRKRFPDEDEARAEAGRFVEFCSGRAWVFTDTGTTPSGERLYEFTHRTFLEFFTAEHLVRTCRTPDVLAAELGPRIARAEWDIVAQLAFQLQDNNLEGAGDELLDALMQAADAPDASGRDQLLDFVSRALSFLVPEPETLTRVASRITATALENYAAADTESSIDGTSAFRALAEVNWENRAVIAEAVDEVVMHAASKEDVSVPGLFEIGLHLDVAVSSGRTQRATRRFWEEAAESTASKLRSILVSQAKADADAAIDGFSFGFLSPDEIAAHHSAEVFFQDRRFWMYPGKINSSMADLLVSVASGASPSWIVVRRFDDLPLAEWLGQLGSILRSARPPFLSTNVARIEAQSMLQCETHDPLGSVSGDVAFGLAGLLGVTLEMAERSGELGEMMTVLRSSEVEWHGQMLGIAEARFGAASASIVEEEIAQLGMSDGDNDAVVDWVEHNVSLVSSVEGYVDVRSLDMTDSDTL